MSELRCRATSPSRGWQREVVVNPSAARVAAAASTDVLARVIAPAMREATAALEAGDIVGAESACRRVLAAYAGMPDALYLLGEAHRARGDVAAARRLIDEALAALPSEALCRATCVDASSAPAHWRCVWCGVDSAPWAEFRGSLL
jgi:hypothetical protein